VYDYQVHLWVLYITIVTKNLYQLNINTIATALFSTSTKTVFSKLSWYQSLPKSQRFPILYHGSVNYSFFLTNCHVHHWSYLYSIYLTKFCSACVHQTWWQKLPCLILWSHELLGIVDGSERCPPKYQTDKNSSTRNFNSACGLAEEIPTFIKLDYLLPFALTGFIHV
jgi:hypothetical protein